MKVAFVYPAFENLGVEYLSAALKQAGHETELVYDPRLFDDCILMNAPLARLFSYRKKMLRRIREIRPDLVAFSLITTNYPWGVQMARDIKEMMDVPILFGGMHVSSMPDKVVHFPHADYFIVGEGERPMVELADALAGGRKEPDIANLWYRRNGTVVSRDVRPPIQDLDSLPFPDKEMYRKHADFFKIGYTALSGRGCTSRCSFCHHSFYGKIYENKGPYLRKRSVENLVEELSRAKASGIQFVRFYDDNFTFSSEWLAKFAEIYPKEVGLPFYCMANPETITPESAACLEAAGCYEVQVGVQTINERTRREILHRRETTPEVIRAIQSVRKTRVRLATDNLIDIPTQSEDELLELARFYNEHRVDRINLYWMTYFPRTDLVEIARSRGLMGERDVREIEDETSSRATYIGQVTSSKELRRHQFLLGIMLFFRPKVVDFILRKRLYRFFPRIPPFFVTTTVSALRSRGEYHFLEKRAKRRYVKFALRRFLP